MNQRLTRRGLESEASGTVIGFAPGVAEESWFSRILEVGLGLGDGLGEGLGDGSGEGLGEGVGITGFGTGAVRALVMVPQSHRVDSWERILKFPIVQRRSTQNSLHR